MAIVMSRRFLRSMAQPYEADETGVSLWSLADIEARQLAMSGAAMDVDMPMPGDIPEGHEEADDAMFAGLADDDFMNLPDPVAVA